MKPYRGKPDVRDLREGDGDVGIKASLSGRAFPNASAVKPVNDRVKRAPKSSRKIPPSRVKDVEFR